MTDQEFELRTALKLGKHDKAARRLYLAAMLAVLRADERPYLAAMDAAAFQAIERALTTLRVTECNRQITTRERNRIEALTAKARKLAELYGLEVKSGVYGMTLSGPALERVKGNPSEIQVA